MASIAHTPRPSYGAPPLEGLDGDEADCAKPVKGQQVRICLRRTGRPTQRLSGPAEVCAALRGMSDLDRESFVALHLDTRNRIIGYEEIARGHLSGVQVHPRELFKAAILANAAAIICAHNHPSGDPTPSAEDRRITERLRRAAEVLGIPILDHVVIGDPSFYSFADNGW